MNKKQWIVAIVLLLLIPAVVMLGGMLFSLINPEIAAGHPNYVRNFHRLSLLKLMILWVSFAAAAVLWLLVCLFVIRAKKRSLLWLLLAALGPFGFAILATLNDQVPAEKDWYARFVGNMKWYVRAGYELCTFVIIGELAYQAMVLKRILMIKYQAATTGVSEAQIIDIQNASSGMWAFGEGMEVMFLVVLLYFASANGLPHGASCRRNDGIAQGPLSLDFKPLITGYWHSARPLLVLSRVVSACRKQLCRVGMINLPQRLIA